MMFEVAKFKELIKNHIEAADTDWDYAIEKAWKALTLYACEDIDGLVRHINTDITGEEFIWLSSVFDEIVQETQSVAFVEALERALLRFPEECKKYSLVNSVKYARVQLD